jgi:hypothetical protein
MPRERFAAALAPRDEELCPQEALDHEALNGREH